MNILGESRSAFSLSSPFCTNTIHTVLVVPLSTYSFNIGARNPIPHDRMNNLNNSIFPQLFSLVFILFLCHFPLLLSHSPYLLRRNEQKNGLRVNLMMIVC